jgi:GGDEF domain-containing protein
MPARLDRVLQLRTADRLRASLARDEASGMPIVGVLAEDDERELRQVGGGRLAAVVIHVASSIDAVAYPLSIQEVQARVMREVARIVNAHVRQTDVLGSLGANALVILAPGIDRMSGLSLAERLRALFVDGHFELGDVAVQARITVGFASRSAASPAGWTTEALVQEAERNTSEPPPIAIVA